MKQAEVSQDDAASEDENGSRVSEGEGKTDGCEVAI